MQCLFLLFWLWPILGQHTHYSSRRTLMNGFAAMRCLLGWSNEIPNCSCHLPTWRHDISHSACLHSSIFVDSIHLNQQKPRCRLCTLFLPPPPPPHTKKTVLYISHEFTQVALDRTPIIHLFTLLLLQHAFFNIKKKRLLCQESAMDWEEGLSIRLCFQHLTV